jgi:epoxyqueuosine reductase QueG
MSISINIKAHLQNQGANFIHFIDISHLSKQQNKKFSTAILFGIALSPGYLNRISETPGYVKKIKQRKQIQNDEFHLTELKTDRMADELVSYLAENGIDAYSQSEANIEATGFYDEQNKITPLPHKTIALMAGLGWIGKHNLLVTPEFGSGISMCSVLCNISEKTVRFAPSKSECGTCTVCVEICPTNALNGNSWEMGKSREHIIDVHSCTTCYECVVHCPWTKKFIHNNL